MAGAGLAQTRHGGGATRSTNTGDSPAEVSSSINKTRTAHQALGNGEHLLLAARQGHRAIVALATISGKKASASPSTCRVSSAWQAVPASKELSKTLSWVKDAVPFRRSWTSRSLTVSPGPAPPYLGRRNANAAGAR